MWPTILPGYTVRYQSCNPDTLHIGDLVVVRGRGRLGEKHFRVHRIIDRLGPYFLEAGDNTYRATLVHGKDILGRVTQLWDDRKKAVEVPSAPEKLRFGFFRLTANGFFFLHEVKDRILGDRKSYLLWKLSEAYRAALRAAGVEVPAIPPT